MKKERKEEGDKFTLANTKPIPNISINWFSCACIVLSSHRYKYVKPTVDLTPQVWKYRGGYGVWTVCTQQGLAFFSIVYKNQMHAKRILVYLYTYYSACT